MNAGCEWGGGVMTQLGIQIIPTMPADEVVEIAVMAEALGYDFCVVADEGFMPDIYVTLGAIAQRTQRMQLGPVTNGYTRHPAVTANALATLDDLSGGRWLDGSEPNGHPARGTLGGHARDDCDLAAIVERR